MQTIAVMGLLILAVLLWVVLSLQKWVRDELKSSAGVLSSESPKQSRDESSPENTPTNLSPGIMEPEDENQDAEGNEENRY